MQSIFVTSSYRSGSTLLDKLLHNHPSIQMGSQPSPFLYFAAKSKFLQEHNLIRRYPLEHLFGERDYTPKEFTDFLKKVHFQAEEIHNLFDNMLTSGQHLHMPDFLQYCLQQDFYDGNFLSVHYQILQQFWQYLGKKTITHLGMKEIFCEEYIPFFLEHGYYVILLIRDLRDVLTSVNYGEGEVYVGKIRPTLYTIRQWRKSVSFSIAYQGHPKFLALRYEDLIQDQTATLAQITEFLGVESYPEKFTLYGQDGRLWKHNSSFIDEVKLQPVGRYHHQLPLDTIRYIEATSFPEMAYHHYALNAPLDETILDTFREPQTITHQNFEPDYSYHLQRIEVEKKRIQQLRQIEPISLDIQEQMYIFPKTYQVLHELVRTL